MRDLSLKLLTLKLNALFAQTLPRHCQDDYNSKQLYVSDAWRAEDFKTMYVPGVLKTPKESLEIKVTRFEACDELCAYLTVCVSIQTN